MADEKNSDKEKKGPGDIREETAPPTVANETARIDLSEAETSKSTGGVPPSATARIALPRPSGPNEIANAVDQTGAGENATRPVVDDEVTKSETARIETKPAPNPSGTSRIRIEEAKPGEDVFHRQQQPVIEEAKGPSKLSRKAMPADEHKAPSDTDKQKQDLAKAETDEIPLGGDPAPGVADAPGKSKTARIDIPAEAVAAGNDRPMTIKIKRTERPASTVSGAGRPKVQKAKSAPAGKDLGAFYSVLATMTVIASLVLVYVLAAQTIAVDMALPFPGKIGG